MKRKARTSEQSASTPLVAKLKNEPAEFVEAAAQKMIAELIPVLQLLGEKYGDDIAALKSLQDVLQK